MKNKWNGQSWQVLLNLKSKESSLPWLPMIMETASIQDQALYFTLGLPYLLECSSLVVEFLNAAGGLAYWL